MGGPDRSLLERKPPPGMWLTCSIHHHPQTPAVQVAREQRQQVSRDAELFELCQKALVPPQSKAPAMSRAITSDGGQSPGAGFCKLTSDTLLRGRSY
ncbi:hypothetical protein GWK47_002425 [Chionoecetes opilio]|uniref:Uncharacterized protein n=1 Tax=Chionoecetes opilio TaxID=41210 RepID=A0A8J5CE04_CHIOP|nr:hypothetical protein GWK47_002425 [Chionoecetes opilio]